MLLSFDAKQKLKLSVTRNKEYLSKYLLEEERVVGAMLDSKKLVPKKILESTGHSVLNGILLGIKTRVQQQLVKDFLEWCELNKI